MSFICITIKNHFHVNGFALSLALKVRFFGTRKWPICNTQIISRGGGVLLGNLGGGVLPCSSNQNVIFHTRFQTRPLKSIPVFRPGFQAEIVLSLLRLERKQSIIQIHFEFAYFSFFLSYSLGIETINTFIHSLSYLENHTLFQTKTAQKPYPMGRHIPVRLI